MVSVISRAPVKLGRCDELCFVHTYECDFSCACQKNRTNNLQLFLVHIRKNCYIMIFYSNALWCMSVVFSTSADAGEGSSTGATASGQQPVMFGGISECSLLAASVAYVHNTWSCFGVICMLWSLKMSLIHF